MTTTHMQIAHRIDTLFSKAEQKYKELFINVTDETEAIASQNLNNWTNDNTGSYLTRIATHIVQLHKNQRLKKEIQFNQLNRNLAYHGFFMNILSKRLAFIEDYILQGTKYYNQFEYSQSLINKMYKNESVLDRKKLKEAIQMEFVHLVNLLEWLYANYSGKYQGQLKATLIPTYNEFAIPPIALNYGDNNEKVLNIMYKMLIREGCIDVDDEEFKAHFRPSGNLPKMKWHRTASILTTVFIKDLTLRDSHTTNVPSVVTKNADKTQMVLDHFCDKNGQDLNKRTIIQTCSKPMRNVQKIDGFTSELMAIEKIRVQF